MASRNTAKIKGRFQPVQMGLGDAIRRLIHIEWTFRTGATAVPEQLLEEREMLLEALNVVPIDVGFDCNADGVPDTVEIFQQAASTSCCRLMPPGSRAPVKRKPKTAAAKKKAPKAKKSALRRLIGSGGDDS